MCPDARPSPDRGDASSSRPETGEAPAPIGAGDTEAAERAPGVLDWDRLPDPVRGRLAEVAAVAVGGLPISNVPVPLRRLARFTPAKRARLGAGPLLAELRASAVFRSAVLAWWAEQRPGELDVHCEEPLRAAAAAVLSGAPETDEVVAAAARRGEVAELRAERDAALARVDKLTVELERLRAELADAREQARCADQLRDAEFAQLRRRVSEQGAKLRVALDARVAAETTVEELRGSASAELAQALAERDRERARAEEERRRAARATAEIAAARQAAREARQADEVRLGLLIDTLSGAVAGLRRELAFGGGGPRPGDLVAGAHGARAGAPVDDRAALDALLALRTVHLVVDGYNVSKTGYPELPLADQRTRLVRQLGALAARTGVEITVVFDGAGVVAAPTRGSRGVRVLFSDAGVLADDVIRSLVAAEPEGRPVLVATSDRAVVESVRRRGAHALPSAVLLARLRG
ncbi:NYN domain-containing protein [Pseudonocardia asaccharolytica]|uniref:RNA-binding protein n=1 Tax=Pseudonocardia asaccharolytica DSM 44247 = NBRC 16224 TaxID=1123024 RepID=A0A511CY42_9PSEU|nr:NYN domain-containing protein [Pseudonocardia asaccharolytica]GEL17163.1 RNA-binding protein [Pseudonocardia asaccharolytica DSM 44247 = NBRC 16224]